MKVFAEKNMIDRLAPLNTKESFFLLAFIGVTVLITLDD